MTIATGTRLGRYEVLSPLGRGGMGEVYKARDTRLGRDVAIKVLPPHLTENPELRQRFEREARAISQLHHPHVCTVHDVGSEQGVDYLVMEYLEGETLDDRLRRGALPVAEVLVLGGQIAEAIEAAHRQGLVHRDLKPGNVMLTASGAKVLDFGLAREIVRREASSDTRAETLQKAITEEGTLVGTMPYMAPEQLQGRPADARTDVWALGCVLYEMATGVRPFLGQSQADLIGAILATQPEPPTRKRPLAPERLDGVVKRCLEKDPERRWQRARDVAIELEEIAGAASTPTTEVALPAAGRRASVGRRTLLAVALLSVLVVLGAVVWRLLPRGAAEGAIDSIAVLPFVNASGDPDAEYLNQGIASNIVNGLSSLQLPNLRVVPWSTASRYRGPEVDPQEVGRALKVRAVLVGSVTQLGDRLTIQTELVDVAQDAQLWGQQYQRSLSEILPLQDEIARDVSDRLRLKLSGEEQRRLTEHHTEDPRAHLLYLKGRGALDRFTHEGRKQARRYFEEAIALDPRYASAHAGVAYATLQSGELPPREAYTIAKAAIDRALELDDSLAEAHNTLGTMERDFNKDWATAENAFKRAIALDPAYADAHHQYSHLLASLGRNEESLAESLRVLEIDPLDPAMQAHLGWHYLHGSVDQAIAQCRKALEIGETYQGHHFLALAYGQQGRYEDAIAELKQARVLDPPNLLALASLGHAYAKAGREGEARRVLDELDATSMERSDRLAYKAFVYAGLGDADQALQWLERAHEERVAWLRDLAINSEWDGLRSDPRFKDLLRRLGLAPATSS